MKLPGQLVGVVRRMHVEYVNRREALVAWMFESVFFSWSIGK